MALFRAMLDRILYPYSAMRIVSNTAVLESTQRTVHVNLRLLQDDYYDTT